MKLKERYTSLATVRDSLYEEMSQLAQLTIPSILPPIGSEEDTKFPIPYQSLGANGVQTLASKLLMSLFPPNLPFFKLVLSDVQLKKITGSARGEVEMGLNTIEREVVKYFETGNTRIRVIDALTLLIMSGNFLARLMPNLELKIYRLDSYVLTRDAADNVMEIILHERMSRKMLPERILKLLGSRKDEQEVNSLTKVETMGESHVFSPYTLKEDEVDIYTCCQRTSADTWEISQEVEGVDVTGKSTKYKGDAFPFFPVTYNKGTTDTYGRGYIDNLKGDLISFEVLSAAIHEFSIAAARTIFLARPGSVIDRDLLQEAPNLSVLQGEEGDVTTIRVEKGQDMQIVYNYYNTLEKRLGIAFLQHMAIQRDGERVTAEEIRALTQELDAGKGGLHSVVAQQFQLPLIKLLLAKHEEFGIPKLPKEIKPMITTGVQSFGRNSDYESLRTVFADFGQLLGPELLAENLHLNDALKRALAAKGIDTVSLVKTAEEKAAKLAEQQAMMQEQQSADMLGKAAPTIAKAMTEPQGEPA